MRLDDNTAIVTGAASGFGEGIARRFTAEGARVMVADLNAAAAEALAVEIGGMAHEVDVADNSRVDILVNNAGITHLPTAMEDVPEDAFDRILAVDAKSVYLTARHLVPEMKQAGTGVILNMASSAGLSPRPGLNRYSASKGWTITVTKAMAVERAPHGIRVNALCPVAGNMPLLPGFPSEDAPVRRAAFLATIPLGRLSTPEDLADAALYLCSDEASMITGVAMQVDGGRCI